MQRARDKLKDDNTRLRQQAGLAGDEVLLRDMEQTVDAAADLRARVEVKYLLFSFVALIFLFLSLVRNPYLYSCWC